MELNRSSKKQMRVAKPNAIVAAWGYGLLYIDPVIDELIVEFRQGQGGTLLG